MPRSARLRVQDVRRIASLVGECRELGDDSTEWRRHLFAGLGGLAGAVVVMGGELAGVHAGRVTYTGITDWGWANGYNRLGWERAIAEMAADPALSRIMSFAGYLQQMLLDDGVSLSRTDMISDYRYYRSWEYENLPHAAGVDHSLFCFHSLPGTADEFNGLFLNRAGGDADFSSREKAMIRTTLQEIRPLVGGPLARFCDPSPGVLPKRVRQVLKCLLEGDSDKQIAARLGISQYTVNGYTKLIFKHFRVASRPELLARWIRRGWGGKFAWVERE